MVVWTRLGKPHAANGSLPPPMLSVQPVLKRLSRKQTGYNIILADLAVFRSALLSVAERLITAEVADSRNFLSFCLQTENLITAPTNKETAGADNVRGSILFTDLSLQWRCATPRIFKHRSAGIQCL